MKKFYFLSLLCCLGFASYAQIPVTIWATTSGSPDTTGSSTATAITHGNIVSGNFDETRGYAVFDLSGIPAGAVITYTQLGFDVAAYAADSTTTLPHTLVDNIWHINGIGSDLGSILVPGSLFAAMAGGTSLYTTTWGGAVGDPTFVGGPLLPFIQGEIPPTGTAGKVTLSFVTDPTTTVIYTITGETGNADVFTPGHAPYLTIEYCPVPTAVTAAASGTPCAGGTLSLVGTATGSAGGVLSYAWAGPGGFTSTEQNPTFTTTYASTGVYTLTATNTCSGTVATTTAVSSLITVDGGAIQGVTNVWQGYTDTLSDFTPGGTWTSSDTLIARINPATGVDSGVIPGTVTITYTTILGCVFTTPVQVVASAFTQIPLDVGGAGVTGIPLEAWYPFCGNSADKSSLNGSGPNPLRSSGTGITPATLTSDRFGEADDAYYFDGVDNVMYTPSFFPALPPTPDYTYSLWFETDTIQNSIIAYNGNSNMDGFGFVMNNGGTAGGSAGNYVSILFGGLQQFVPTQVSLNRWHNLMLKKNGNSYDFYVDDVSVGFFISPFVAMTSVFAVGGDYSSTTSPGGVLQKAFRGKVDDIAVYNQQLSDVQRDSLFNFNPDARRFSLGNDTTICTDSITLFPTPQTMGNVYTWVRLTIPTDTLSPGDSIKTISPPAGVAGTQYELQLGKPYGCYAYDTIRVYKSPIPINLGPSPLNLCLGDTVTLTDIIPHSASSTFTWSTGDTTNSIRVYSSGNYSVTVDSVFHYNVIDSGVVTTVTNVCVGRDTVKVHVYAVPIIGLPAQYSNCNGAPYTIRPYVDSAYTYLWNDGTTGDTLVATTTGITIYTVKVTDTGCSKIDTISVLIVYDTLTFNAHDTAICAGQFWPPVNPDSFLVTDNGIANYQWTPTAGMSVSNVANPTITPDTSAEYILTVTYPRCPTFVDSFYLDVQPNPVVYPGNNRSVCQFDTIHVIAGVTPAWYGNYSYTWTPAGSLDASTNQTVVFSPVDTGTVNLIVTVSTPVGCSAKDSLLLFVHPGNFLFDTTFAHTVCPGDSIQLLPQNIMPGIVTISSYRWTPGLYLSDSTSATPVVHAVTSLDYRLVGTSQFGCKDTLNYDVTVAPAAVLYMPDSVTIFPGESYLISPETNCANFLWFPPLDIDNIYSSTPTVTPDENTTYIVRATTEAGCKITDSIKILIVAKPLVDIPNAFTPGAGVNNKFMAIPYPNNAVSLIYFRIYNRWGNMVFETKDFNDGWDGTYNGKPQPFGVYVYELQAKATNGEVFQRQGNVTLLR